MRFHSGAIPENPTFHPEAEDWRSIREPGPIAIQILAIPVAVLLMILTGWLFWQFLPSKFIFEEMAPYHLELTIVVLFLLLPVHELLHALCHPGFGFSNQTVLGVWPSKLLLYAHYEGALSRNRFLVIVLSPLIGLTLIPLVILALLSSYTPSLNVIVNLGCLAFVNAASASGDVIAFFAVLLQIPASGVIQNQGWRTFWKPVAELSLE